MIASICDAHPLTLCDQLWVVLLSKLGITNWKTFTLNIFFIVTNDVEVPQLMCANFQFLGVKHLFFKDIFQWSKLNLNLNFVQIYWSIWTRIFAPEYADLDRRILKNIYPCTWLTGRVCTFHVVVRGFKPWPSHTKDLKNGTNCFLATHSA